MARDPGIRLRDIAATVGIIERVAHRIVSELVDEGYVVRERPGRRNHYQVKAKLPLRHPLAEQLEVGDLLGGTGGLVVLPMPWFEVPIEGEGLVQAEQALNRVQIPTLGPGYTTRGDRKSPEGARVPRHMLAVLEAESAEDAEAHVEENLPDGVYDIGPAEPRQSGSA